MAPRPWLVAGFGCRQGCTAAELRGLLLEALNRAGARLHDIKGVSTLARRSTEPGLVTLAADLGLPLAGYTAAELAPFEPLLSHRSALSFHHTGCHGVAESAALAHSQQLGAAPARLLVTRQRSAMATVALATT